MDVNKLLYGDDLKIFARIDSVQDHIAIVFDIYPVEGRLEMCPQTGDFSIFRTERLDYG